MRILFCLVILISFNLNSNGQNACSEYYPFSQGTISEITTYDKKGKVSAITNYTITESGSDKATITMRMNDKDGELITESNYGMTCNSTGIDIDINSMYSPQLFAQYENMETNVTGSDIILPNNMKIGDELPDAEMNVSVDMGGVSMNIDVMMLDRKVVDEESVTTPAGTFDCVVIEYNSKIKMGLERKGSAKQWIAKGVGMVKQEDYNKKGKVTSSTLLTAFTK